MADNKGKEGGKSEPFLTPKGQEVVDKATAKAIETGKKAAGFLGGMFKKLDAAWNAPAPEKPPAPPAPVVQKPPVATPVPGPVKAKSVPPPVVYPDLEEGGKYAHLPSEHKQLIALIRRLPIDADVRHVLWSHIFRGEISEAKGRLERHVFPTLGPEWREELAKLGTGARWATTEDIINAELVTHKGQPEREDGLYLGKASISGSDVRPDLFIGGEGHLLTVAPTGAGKGQAHVMQNVFLYDGPIVVLDPKGECYRELAWIRRLKGNVFKWAPFDDSIESDKINPLDFVCSWEDALALATTLIPAERSRDPFWEMSARDMITGIIWFLVRHGEPGARTMTEVHRLVTALNAKVPANLRRGEDEGETWGSRLIEDMLASPDVNLHGTANALQEMHENEKMRASILAVARVYLSVWASPAIARTTDETSPKWNPASLRDNMAAYERRQDGIFLDERRIDRQGADAVFLIVPPELIASNAPVLRTILGLHIKELLEASSRAARIPHEKDYPRKSTLFLLDELPQLGYVDQVEKAIAIVRAAKIRLWLFAQDLSQLRVVYPQAQTIISNCRVKSFFAINDAKTADEVSDLLGQRQELFGRGKEPLATSQALRGPDFKGQQVLLVSGNVPVRSTLVPLYADETYQAFKASKKPILDAMPDVEEDD
ncbi:type IV secretory system conjugative DNA transfer family protein [Ferrovibrio sp. MS7]|uniref:type IV secretory system conjugative DNA transfer family protein n=1 Tax=Ferrovibrio plantarum TaxID=3119164 RepID=UPI0031373DA8